jgi:hypothetical protein
MATASEEGLKVFQVKRQYIFDNDKVYLPLSLDDEAISAKATKEDGGLGLRKTSRLKGLEC